MGELDYGMMAAYAIGILLLYIIGKTFAKPFKLFGKVLLNLVLGAVILLAINYVGQYISFNIPFNILTSLIVGFLGIPGVVLVIILTKLFI